MMRTEIHCESLEDLDDGLLTTKTDLVVMSRQQGK